MPLNMLVKVLKYVLKYASIKSKNIYSNNNLNKGTTFPRVYYW